MPNELYIVMQESAAPVPAVGRVREYNSDGRVLIRLFEGMNAPDGVDTIDRVEAETMLESSISWNSPNRPWNL